jgi:hypothetical protein
MQSDTDMTDDNFQERAFGQNFCDQIWGIVADFTNVT